jgi:serine/threonine protein kinase
MMKMKQVLDGTHAIVDEQREYFVHWYYEIIVCDQIYLPIELSSGDVLDSRYSLDKVIGRGSFGQVVRAFDKLTRLFVAIKIIKRIHSCSEKYQMELKILEHLKKHDPSGRTHTGSKN